LRPACQALPPQIVERGCSTDATQAPVLARQPPITR